MKFGAHIFPVVLGLIMSLEALASIPSVGLILNYDCPHCKNIFEKRTFIEQACALNSSQPKCDIRYMPMISDTNDKRALVYYSSRKLDSKVADQVNETFFTIERISNTEHSYEEIAAMLTSMVPNINWEYHIGKYSEVLGQPALSRLIALMQDVDVRDYPSFLWITDNKIVLIPVSMNPAERLSDAIQFIRENTNDQ